MLASISIRRNRKPASGWLTLGAIVTASLVSLGACGGDTEPRWEVSASLSSRTLSADGSDSANAVVFVLDQDRNPAPIGSAVLVTCINQAQQPAGRLNGSDTGLAQLQLDGVGGTELEIRCSGAGDVDDTLVCFARYDGENTVLPIISCQA